MAIHGRARHTARGATPAEGRNRRERTGNCDQNALDRSDRGNPETRARIYQSARLALESGLRKQDVTDPEIVSQQRQRLETIIHAIETEERFALGSTAGKVVPPSWHRCRSRPTAVLRRRSRSARPSRWRCSRPVATAPVCATTCRRTAPRPRVEIERDSRPQRRFWGGAQSAAAPGSVASAVPASDVRVETPAEARAVEARDLDPASDPLVQAPVAQDAALADDPLAGLQSAPLRADPVTQEARAAAPAEERRAPQTIEPVVAQQAPVEPPRVQTPSVDAPQVETPDAGARREAILPRPELVADRKVGKRGKAKAERPAKARKKRSSLGRWLFSTFLVLATLGAGIGAAAWWLDKQGCCSR